MYLTFEHYETSGTEDFANRIDLSAIAAEDDVLDWEDLRRGIIDELVKWCIEREVDLYDTFPLYLVDAQIWEDPEEYLDVSGDTLLKWPEKVAKFAWFVENLPSWIESDQVWAVVDNVHWEYVDFDNLKSFVEDDFHGEFLGDYEDFAQEWHENTSDFRLPEHMYHFVDWRSYGESLVSDFSEVRWNDRTFLYYR